jgi:hypothetical protein
MKKRTEKMNQNYQSQIQVKQKKEATDKKIAFTTTFPWSWVLRGV